MSRGTTWPAESASWRRQRLLSCEHSRRLLQQAFSIGFKPPRRHEQQGDGNEAELSREKYAPGIAAQRLGELRREDTAQRGAQQVQPDDKEGDHRGADFERR